MSYCDKHIPLDGCIPGDEVMVRRYDECPVCVHEEWDRLRDERRILLGVNDQYREERDRLRSQLDEAVRLLKRRMHCDICECHGCLEIRKVIEG